MKRRHPEAMDTPIVVPYGTDANSFRPKGVKSYGFTPVIVPAEAAMSMHGDADTFRLTPSRPPFKSSSKRSPTQSRISSTRFCPVEPRLSTPTK